MLYDLLFYFSTDFSVLNVTKYITFRANVSLLTALFLSIFLSPWLIRKLKSKQLGQVVRQDGPKSHFSKAGVPTMGGALIILSVVVPAFLWMDLRNPYFWYCMVIFLGYGILGFLDDYAKITKKNSKGVSGKVKLFWQILLATLVCSLHYYFEKDTKLTIPFLKMVHLDLGLLYIPFSVLVIVGASNAVNLTDGLDGLAIGPVMISAACFAVLSYVSGNLLISNYLNFPYVRYAGELTIFASCLIGAGMGFLWYNSYPAQVFMGDVGSLPLGGALGVIAVLSKHEILLAIIGGVFVVEAVSVITQVISFKLTGKRIFRMAPIHHHFELKGWPEPKVIVRFWIISAVLALVGLLSLKIR